MCYILVNVATAAPRNVNLTSILGSKELLVDQIKHFKAPSCHSALIFVFVKPSETLVPALLPLVVSPRWNK